MLSQVVSGAVLGIDAYNVNVEVDLALGLPAVQIVGLPDNAVRESKERVRSALKNTGFRIPSRRITVNLAPADIRKEGAAFDLPIAVGILASSGSIEFQELERWMVVGELALDGRVRPIRGALSLAAVQISPSAARSATSRAMSRSSPIKAAIAPSPTGTAFCMAWPRTFTRWAVSTTVKLRAAARAEYSPTE